MTSGGSGGGSASLCETFSQLATWTWTTLQRAQRVNITFGEESVTDHLLVELAHRHPTEVVVHKFTRRKEALVGADWEWWFGGTRGWWGMLVQAKILDPTSLRFASLNYQRKRKKQITTLLGTAQQRGLYAAYCLYGSWPAGVGSGPRTCPLPIHMPSVMGCMFVDAHAVARLVNRRPPRDQLQHLLPLAVPWSCLVCCPRVSTDSLAQRVRDVAATTLLETARLAVRPAGRGRFTAVVPPDVPDVRLQLPDHVQRLLNPDLNRAEVEAPGGASVAGVVVIRDRPG